jgi:hypothetical protein
MRELYAAAGKNLTSTYFAGNQIQKEHTLYYHIYTKLNNKQN